VWQWCNDWYGSYGAAGQTDPTGPSGGSSRVLRGGSWEYGIDVGDLRSASRGSDAPGDKGDAYVGFRCVRR